MTPPAYDDCRAGKQFSDDAVLGHYANWLLSRRDDGWLVIDLHAPVAAELAQRRQMDPEFTFQPDAIHPSAEGHWFMARQMIRWFDDAEAADAPSPEAMLEAQGVEPGVMKLVEQRMSILRNAHLAAAGHTRPGIPAGLPLPEAYKEAREIIEAILEPKQ